MNWSPVLSALSAIIFVFSAVSTGAAQSASERALILKGKALAELWCANCHVVGSDSQQTALSDAPPFETLAERPDFDEEALAFALFNPHPVMPQFNVTRQEVRILSRYIQSLAPSGERSSRDVESGQAIAMENCARCHAVSGSGPSPNPDAPVFSGFSKYWPIDSLAEALAEGIVVNHRNSEMPEFQFEPDQIDSLLAFISSVQN